MLSPLTTECMEYAVNEYVESIDAIITNVEKRKNDPDALDAYLVVLRQIKNARDFRTTQEWGDLVQGIKPDDAMYFFKFRQGEYSDYGILVIRAGRIVFRTILGSGMSAVAGKEESVPENVEFNNL